MTTNPLTTIGLTFDATDVQLEDALFLEIVSGLDTSATVRGEDVTVPYADGQTPRPRRFHERRILLAGYVTGNGATPALAAEYYRANVRAMLALFDPAADPAALVATLEGGATTATITARTLSVISETYVPSLLSYVSIELLATEDWTYSA